MSGLLEIFFSPGKVFHRVRERSMFLPGLIGVMLLAVASFAVLANLVGMETMTRKQFESNPRMAERLGPENIEKAIQASGSPTRKALGYCAAAIGSAIVMLAVAGISLGGLVLMGAKVNFLQMLGATSYGWFPFSFLNFVMTTIILLLAPDRDSLDFRNIVATNVGAFLNKETTGKALLSVANSVDILSFAEIAFLGYGFSKVSGLSWGKCSAVVFALWAVYVLCKTAIAAI